MSKTTSKIIHIIRLNNLAFISFFLFPFIIIGSFRIPFSYSEATKSVAKNIVKSTKNKTVPGTASKGKDAQLISVFINGIAFVILDAKIIIKNR